MRIQIISIIFTEPVTVTATAHTAMVDITLTAVCDFFDTR